MLIDSINKFAVSEGPYSISNDTGIRFTDDQGIVADLKKVSQTCFEDQYKEDASYENTLAWW